jgi:hypothetical protein
MWRGLLPHFFEGKDLKYWDNPSSTFTSMTIQQLREAYGKEKPTQIHVSEYALEFGKYRGVPLKNVPPQYLQWVVVNVKNRPEPVSMVRKYLKLLLGQQVEIPGMRSRVLPSTPVLPISAGEGGDLLIQPYPEWRREHPLMYRNYDGKPLHRTYIQDLEKILERNPADEGLRDFINCRTVCLYGYFVWRTYKQALQIDFSSMDEEGRFKYAEIMDACRRIRHVIDTIVDPALAKDALRSPQFDGVLRMVMPETIN